MATVNIERLQSLDQSTPFLAIDLSKITANYQRLKRSLPDFSIYYAMKSNPEKEILQALHADGCHFEIASIGELRRLQAVGVDPTEVIFSNPVKINDHIAEAYKAGVRYFAIDSDEEVQKIAQYAPGSNVYARISVSNHGSIIDLSDKFGVESTQVVALMGLAKDSGLHPSGLSFHVGSQSENTLLWDEALALVSDLLERLESAGMPMETVNIGGGIPVKYDAVVPTIEEVADVITGSVKKHIPSHIKLICEPGRGLVGDAGVIAATIIGRITRKNQNWLFLDTGRFQSFIELFESEAIRYPVLTAANDMNIETYIPYTLTGPTCDSHDTIMHNVYLPPSLKSGQKLYFASAGAYTHVYGSAFNDIPVPTVVFDSFIMEEQL